jgi:ubiquinone/menaquinone biosynthesis C-methylase UbiE
MNGGVTGGQSIAPEVYDRDYFLSEICEGFDEFREGGISYNKAKQVRLLAPAPGLRVLDAGCGRGETLLACARAGAEVAGVDYSAAAVGLTRELLEGEGFACDIRLGSVTSLPWPDATFDRIQFSDVIEHLDPHQTVPALAEFHRVLRPGGYLLVHTAPNLLFMKYGWPAVRPAVRLAGHREIAEKVDRWFRIAEEYHVNEQSTQTLRRALSAAGFSDPRVWVDKDVLRGGQFHLLNGFEGPPVRIARRVASWRPIRAFLGNDVLAIASR